MSYFEIIIIAIAVTGSAIIKNGVGGGAGIFLLPFLAMVLPPKLALGLGAPAMLISDIVGVKNYWGEWDTKELKILLPLAALGVLFGCYLIKVTPDTLFKQYVSVFALLFSSVHIVKMIKARYFSFNKAGRHSAEHDSRHPLEHADRDSLEHAGRHSAEHPVEKSNQGRVLTVLFGFLGGVASTVAHAGGLVMSVYLIEKRAGPRVFVGTLVLFFAIINIFKLIAYVNIGIITSRTMLLVVVLSPAIILGGMAGNALNKKIPQELFRLIVLILIFLIGIRLQ